MDRIINKLLNKIANVAQALGAAEERNDRLVLDNAELRDRLQTTEKNLAWMTSDRDYHRNNAGTYFNKIEALKEEHEKAGRLPPDAQHLMRVIIRGVQEGERIPVIKAVRTVLGMDLKPAKDMVDTLMPMEASPWPARSSRSAST